jgi:ankyrin repeat protein
MDPRSPRPTGVPLDDEQTRAVVAMAMDLARRGATDQLIEFVDHGLPIDVQDEDGNTALMLASYHGHPSTVRALMDRGADGDLRNNRDQSPIAGALFKGADEIVALLRDAGADLDAGTPSARAAAELFGRAHLLG